MSEIESKVKVIRNTAQFDWVKNLIFVVGQQTLSPEKRNDELNAILLLTSMYIAFELKQNPQTMEPVEVLKISMEYLPKLIYYYCCYYLTINQVEITSEIMTSLQDRTLKCGLKEKYNKYLGAIIKGEKVVFELDSSISNLSFGSSSSPDAIIAICHDYIPVRHNLEVITELVPGMSVCECTLISLLSKTDKSEIWKCKYKSIFVAIKLEDLDMSEKELKTIFVKSSNFDKIIRHIEETDLEYINYMKLKDFPYKLDYFKIGYYAPLNKKVKRMSLLEGPVDTVEIEDKKKFFQDMFQILYELHKRGLMYNSVNPHHIMFKPLSKDVDKSSNNYRLIDYRNIVEFKGADISSHENIYKSLSLLSDSKICTPYDDIESLFYLFNTIINGKISYTDKNDEKLKKTQLTSFSYTITESINRLRILRQQDIYVNTLENPDSIVTYIDSIYKHGIRISETETSDSIIRIATYFLGSFKSVPGINIKLSAVDHARLKTIRDAFTADPRFESIVSNHAKFNDITLKILNFITNTCQYDAEDDAIIQAFLLG